MKLILNAIMATLIVAFVAAAPLQAACPGCGASKDAQSKECPRKDGKDKDDKEKNKDGKDKDDKEKDDKGKCPR